MKLTVDRSVFLKALSHGQSVVERRGTIPILSNVLLNATPMGLNLITTDKGGMCNNTIQCAF